MRIMVCIPNLNLFHLQASLHISEAYFDRAICAVSDTISGQRSIRGKSEENREYDQPSTIQLPVSNGSDILVIPPQQITSDKVAAPDSLTFRFIVRFVPSMCGSDGKYLRCDWMILLEHP